MQIEVSMSATELILKELVEITGTDHVRADPDLALYEDGVLDSLGTIELIVALEKDFGLEISPAQIDRQMWATPRKIISYIEGRIRS
jgi:D-alanine--poly(phosphoribitol) ligase subunit 2